MIEKTPTGFSAYSPDVLGCVTTGKTVEKTIERMKEALEFHLESLVKDGEEIPQPRGVNAYLEAVQMSEGEDFLLTHIPLREVLPEGISK